MSPTPPKLAPLALLTALLLAAPAGAESPRDELLRYVPDDAGFCVVAQGLRTRFADLADSPFAEKALQSALVKNLLASKEWAQLKKLESYFHKHLGLSWATLRDDLLGEASVFAYRPGPPGRPEQEDGLFLLRAREEKTLATFVAKFNAFQQGTGELKGLDELTHNGVKYHRRREAKETAYYLIEGPVLLFTGQESMLKSAIDQRRSKAVDSPMAKRLRDLKLDQATVALAINPRALDAHVTAKNGDPGATMAVSCWKALEGVGLSLDVQQDVRLRLSLRMKTADLPPSARRFFAAARKPSELWAGFPDNALLAVGGRIDLSALGDFLGESMSKAARQAAEAELDRTVGAILGKSVVKELLPAIGPDWGLCVTAPPAEAKGWAPAVTLALRVARGDESDPVDEAVMSSLLSWAQLVVLGHNKAHPDRPLSLRSMIIDGVRARLLQGDGVFPDGVQPAFALKAGYLVLASAQAELRRFKGGAAGTPGEVPMLRLSLKDWRAYLERRREQLAEVMAGRDGLTRESALAKIDEVRGALEFLDRVELRQSNAPGFASFTLTLVPSAPMRK